MAERGEEETPIQIITVTEDQCGYCLESGTRRVDPRSLPCGHSFCLLCLTDDFARINAVRCPVCRFVYISESNSQYVKLNVTILEVARSSGSGVSSRPNQFQQYEVFVNFSVLL